MVRIVIWLNFMPANFYEYVKPNFEEYITPKKHSHANCKVLLSNSEHIVEADTHCSDFRVVLCQQNRYGPEWVTLCSSLFFPACNRNTSWCSHQITCHLWIGGKLCYKFPCNCQTTRIDESSKTLRYFNFDFTNMQFLMMIHELQCKTSVLNGETAG